MKNTYLAREAYHRIKKLSLRRMGEYTSLVAEEAKDPFKILVATILSQNTNDRNSIKAYIRLEEKIGVSIRNILRASTNDIAESIKVGGLHNVKARKIKEIAQEIFEVYGSKLDWVEDEETQVAKEKLIRLPGVGEKTADILLLYYAKPAFPVDTHIKRISKRLGLVHEKASYKEISNIWMKSLEKDEYRDAHLELIAFGRRICRAKNPVCKICPLKDICKYYSQKVVGETVAKESYRK